MAYLYQRYNGQITKYIIIDGKYLSDVNTGNTFKYDDKLLLGKTSPNIIDLIEVGDYVNGDKIVYANIYSWNDNLENITIIEGTTKGEIAGEDIKSIVTKEQFNSIKYVVGGKEE